VQYKNCYLNTCTQTVDICQHHIVISCHCTVWYSHHYKQEILDPLAPQLHLMQRRGLGLYSR